MVCITGLELFALSQQVDGVLLSGALVLIAGVAGYESKILKDRLKK